MRVSLYRILLVVADVARVGFDEASIEDAARKALEIIGLDGFQIQIKAVGEQVWLRVYVDDASPKSAFAGNLQADESKEFTPERNLRIQCSKDKSASLEITINGRPAKVPFNMKGSLAEVTLSKDDYEKFLQ